ncbi:glutathione S-transferase family protein [uncultured Zhongshania sp.]|uniref:glutathione S-transferase family protein n=1 Tax=uncultured Zhongshania sp. TaxID=1642288 RepID=UPI0025FCF1F8|nr:glutathione S-transferase family protein [uncultured Zhongshania sp.]
MAESIILHHYDNSPYAEKIRLMFGLTNTPWSSLLSPAWPPRPNLDPLTGGYRRIPVAQIGADIFCDSALIAQEVARLSGSAALDPTAVDGDALELMKQAEGQAFFAAIGTVPPLRLITTMLKGFGPIGTYRFVKDRVSLLKGGTSRPPKGDKAKLVMESLFYALDARLDGCAWVGGDNPSVADLAVFHPLWLHVNCNRKPLAASPRIQQWYQRVENIGHGSRTEITQADAFKTARESQPRQVPASVADSPVAIGSAVEVAPIDYGVVPVAGKLAAVTETRIIVARETADFGTLHVHFPRAGYSIVAK